MYLKISGVIGSFCALFKTFNVCYKYHNHIHTHTHTQTNKQTTATPANKSFAKTSESGVTLNSPGTCLYVQQLVLVNNTEMFKVRITGLCAGSHQWRIHCMKGPVKRYDEVYLWHDVIMMLLIPPPHHRTKSKSMDHSGYGLSQWEKTLQCNIISHWLSPYTEWSLKTRSSSL